MSATPSLEVFQKFSFKYSNKKYHVIDGNFTIRTEAKTTYLHANTKVFCSDKFIVKSGEEIVIIDPYFEDNEGKSVKKVIGGTIEIKKPVNEKLNSLLNLVSKLNK